MPFEPGHQKFGGRIKGTPNKRTILRAAFVLAEKGISPTEKLVEIANDLNTPRAVRIELWKFLQTYVEAPQTVAEPLSHSTPEESVANAAKVAEHLREASQPLEPKAEPKPEAGQ